MERQRLFTLDLLSILQSIFILIQPFNGNDFSGKTVKEAESYMEKQVQGYTLTLKEMMAEQK